MADITIGPVDSYYDALHNGYTSIAQDTNFNYDDWLAQYGSNIDLSGIDIGTYMYPENSMSTNDIKLTGGGEEMLRVAEDGFYVRGVKVEADAKEAKRVYKAFKQWMTWAILNGELKN
jgi:hypothetical protein